uniref:Phospholipase A2 n=1 Tax=Marmota marmota marmota TaxID=9994 RepID=A0A8C5ZZ48_MARMA
MRMAVLCDCMCACLMWVQGDLFNFNSMISSVTKKNGATNYGAYGCHCGLGGKGTPKDATDRCCASHDCCYKRLEKRGCGTKSLKKPQTIKLPSGVYFLVISANQGYCRSQLCQCDKTAAYCFAQNLKTYNRKYQFYPNVLCRGKKPSC